MSNKYILIPNYHVGEQLEFAEHDGMHKKKIVKILWREKGWDGIKKPKNRNEGYEWHEKAEANPLAAEWCIFLYDDGTWQNIQETGLPNH